MLEAITTSTRTAEGIGQEALFRFAESLLADRLMAWGLAAK